MAAPQLAVDRQVEQGAVSDAPLAIERKRVAGKPVQIINTHLGLVPREQQIQATHLAGPAWVEHPRCRGARILLGDFNASVHHRALRRLPARAVGRRRAPRARGPACRRSGT